VAQVQPEVFVFENVPGLASGEHKAYLHDIIAKLRAPDDKSPKYGVVAGTLNAADFGVPQYRRRLFMIGFREMPSAFAFKTFDRVYDLATHRDPTLPHPARRPWTTLRESIGQRPDPGGWRRWDY
jgi:site-specific DNA-cytosine methylase